jgi:hypothetical protein
MIFLLFFILVNYIQSKIGLYPKLAKKYKTDICISDHSLFKSKSINLTSTPDLSHDKNQEYRPWLNIQSFEQGLFIGQTRMPILLFPKRFMSPWEQIMLVEEKSNLLKNQYIYKVGGTKKPVYIITKFDLLQSATNKSIK